MELFDQSLTIMERSMDLRMLQQRLIASNLANVDTPGFTAQKLDFTKSMENAVNGLESPAEVYNSPAAPLSLDGNNVDLESELGALSRNKLMYSVTAQLMANKFRQLTTIIENEK